MAEIGPNYNSVPSGGYDPNDTASDYYTGGGYDPNNQNPSGPLSSLDSNPFGIQTLAYPKNIGAENRGHWINFFINVSDNTSYSTKDMNGNAVSYVSGYAGKTATNQTTFANSIGGTIGEATSSFTVRKTKRITQGISLYMPDTVNVTYNAGWESQSLTDAADKIGLAASIASGIKQWSANPTTSGKSPRIAELLGKVVPGTGAGATNFALFSQSYALNPQLEVLFSGTNMREFQFDFLFAPVDASEASAVKEIIKTFRFHMAPEVNADQIGRFFVPPSEFDIDFKVNGQTNKNIHQIGTCVLTGMNVDYGPNGVWSTFQDGTPTHIRMTLQFMETEIVTKQRVADNNY